MKRVVQVGLMFLFVAVFAASCGKKAESPVSPSGAEQAGGNATPAGGLKATAPTAQSPTNGVKPTGTLVLVAGKATMLYVTEGFPLSYEFEILTTSGGSVWTQVVGGGSGSTVSVSPNVSLNSDQTYNWRVRARHPRGDGSLVGECGVCREPAARIDQRDHLVGSTRQRSGRLRGAPHPWPAYLDPRRGTAPRRVRDACRV